MPVGPTHINNNNPPDTPIEAGISITTQSNIKTRSTRLAGQAAFNSGLPGTESWKT